MAADLTQGPSYFAIITGPVLDCMELSDSAKLLYGRITSLADREGYCWASNKYLAEITRCGERTVSRLLAQLEELGFISTGMELTGGKRTTRGRRIYVGQMAAHGVAKIGEGGRQNWRDGVAKNGDTLNKYDNKSLYNPPTPHDEEAQKILFDRFWEAYPKKRGKQEARKAWDKLKPDLALCRTMSAALNREKASKEWAKEGGQYIPYPATWLNGRRWEDEPSVSAQAEHREVYGWQ